MEYNSPCDTYSSGYMAGFYGWPAPFENDHDSAMGYADGKGDRELCKEEPTPMFPGVIVSSSIWDGQDWLPADGRSIRRDKHPGLFNVLGTTYGSDDATTFNLPDTRGRVI